MALFTYWRFWLVHVVMIYLCWSSESLKQAAPQGVDCYFDNVGGDMSLDIIQQMNHRQQLVGILIVIKTNKIMFSSSHKSLNAIMNMEHSKLFKK